MKTINLILTVLTICAPLSFAAECFTSRQQRYTYEQGICAPQENEQLTACLKKDIMQTGGESFNNALASLRKSNNLRTVLPEVVNVFKTSKNPQAVFAAATALISVPEELNIYQKDLIDVLTSPSAQDYKKTLAAIVLTSMDAADSSYTSFLTPALNAKDGALAAYACAAYSILMPGTLDKYLSRIVQLYTFDKVFAQKAFDATGLKERALTSKLQEDLYSSNEALRLSAIEWIGDLGNKKLLLDLLKPEVEQNKEGPTLSSAANALVRNYALIKEDLRKSLKSEPSSQTATIAVMAYSFMGGESYTIIEPLLDGGSDNETANALRVVSSVAGILSGDSSYYPNPKLEREKITKLIAPVAHINKNASNPKVKLYAQSASKELYKLLNEK